MIAFGLNEAYPINSEVEDWPREGGVMLPLGRCDSFIFHEEGISFDTVDSGDPEWMAHVVNTLSGLGVEFLIAIWEAADKFAGGAMVPQFCIALSEEDRDEYMPRVHQAFDIAQSIVNREAGR
ncbi:hypothetical protein E5554_16115 [Sphingobium sp. PAMC28499]|uniref:hypothetical protein n=1 Tax=Sphingobium sp. PAMC28499 TaxID=2565554 RepID=UPI00109DC947|nr:hypothetical protein [Sphingobium sp. PAMC28499]QCB39219.1 hypothetical protein E5554_16115 [Sphingobium sp. PAMC28499]